MKRVEKVLAGFEDNADVVSGCLKDLPPSAWGKETAAAGVVGGGRRLPPRPTLASLESSRERTNALSEKQDKTF